MSELYYALSDLQSDFDARTINIPDHARWDLVEGWAVVIGEALVGRVDVDCRLGRTVSAISRAAVHAAYTASLRTAAREISMHMLLHHHRHQWFARDHADI